MARILNRSQQNNPTFVTSNIMSKLCHSSIAALTIGLSALIADFVSAQSAPGTPKIELLVESEIAEEQLSGIEENISDEIPATVSIDSLEGRVRSLLNSPNRIGFGGRTTGGTERLVVVRSSSADGTGSLLDAVNKAQRGDLITFDPSLKNIKIGSTLKLPADVTIDGRTNSDEVITISPTGDFQAIRAKEGNNILNCLAIDMKGVSRTSIAILEGENFWINNVSVTNAEDDGINIGDPDVLEESADLVTVSNYKITNSIKGLLLNMDGPSCCLLYTSPSPRDATLSRMPSSA